MDEEEKEEEEVRKTCHKCGADVTHSRRHKNAQGEYICKACLDVKKQQVVRERSRKDLTAKSRRILLYGILVAVAGWMLFKVLDIVNQPVEPTE